jgi:signal transduction histidine kinase/CheY-like chemotaxis protein
MRKVLIDGSNAHGRVSEAPPGEPIWRPRLRGATIRVLLAAFAILITAQFIAGRYLYTDGYEEAERRDLLARARHAQAVLQQGFAMLGPAATDYAEWQATRDFVSGTRPEYAEFNWQAWTLKRFNADLVFVLDLKGQVLLGRGLDDGRTKVAPPTGKEMAVLGPGGPLWATLRGEQAREGYTAIGGMPYMWAASAVRGDGEPSTGWLLLLRRLDAAFVGELEKTLDSKARFEVVADGGGASHLPTAPLRPVELQFGATSTDSVEATFVAGLVPGGAHLDLALTTNRPLMATVARLSRYFFWASLVAGALIAMLAMLWLQRRLLGPLREISDRLQDIGSKSDLSARLPAVGRGDEITGVAIAANRMLGQIQAKREAELARDAAVEASRAKSEFLARMSHEIRTPMNGVLGMTELLATTSLDRRQRQYAETIRHSAEALLGIINDTLDFSKIEAGRLELDDSPFDLEEVVEAAAELLAERAHAKGLELVCRVPPGLPTAYRGDGMRLRQVLVNLVGNAVKFTEAGQVVLRVTEHGVKDGRALLRFEVQDTGIGIAEKDQSLIFESFSQVDGTPTRKYGGTGLGLAISRQLVGLMGGEIGVRSAPGQGSTFWFTVQMTQEPVRAAELKPEVLIGSRILVVDDNATNREILREHLESWHVEVTEAAGASQALSHLQSAARQGEPYDLLLLDFQMPGLSGLDLARAIHANVALSDSRVVLLSSVSGHTKEEHWRAAGVSACLTKPVRRSYLYTCLTRLLGEAGTAGGTVQIRQLKLQSAAPLGLQVLLIEDNPVNQEVARGMLAQLGCEAVVASDGRQGVAAFQAGRYDVVLMDCHMPEMDGYEATREIRRWESGRDAGRTPIVALTANALSGDREKCIAAGMDEYLSKPFSAEQLRQVLASRTPAAPQAQAEAVLDKQALEQLRSLQRPGGPDLLGKVIGLYLDNSQGLLERLRGALGAGDPDGLREAAHALKSSSANVGATALAELAKRLEAMGRAADLSQAASITEQLLAEYQRVVRALQTQRASA